MNSPDLFRRRITYLILFLLSIPLMQGVSQSSIQGVINVYTSIDSIYCDDENDVDSLVVANIAGFYQGDTVMLYCVQGALLDTTGIYGAEEIGRDAQLPRNTGKYAFFLIVYSYN